MTPYYEEDGITIYHGDCLEVLPHIANVDITVSSPPIQPDLGNGPIWNAKRQPEKT
jgi:hypothetical protein